MQSDSKDQLWSTDWLEKEPMDDRWRAYVLDDAVSATKFMYSNSKKIYEWWSGNYSYVDINIRGLFEDIIAFDRWDWGNPQIASLKELH
jgi:hypothetical protein